MKACRQSLRDCHAGPDDRRGAVQILNTLAPVGLLWLAIGAGAGRSPWLPAGCALLMGLFLIRAFVLMHDCGHHSLFRSPGANRCCGVLLGVLAGIPQPVWAQHHEYHHRTNGDWERYRGPLSIVDVQRYQAMSRSGQRRYRLARSIWLAPLGGLLYLVVLPRWNWLRASAALAWGVAAAGARRGGGLRTRLAAIRAPGCASLAEYGHMTVNNVLLVASWVLMSGALGVALFWSCYLAAMAVAGGGAIVLFSVQHNFKDSYASATLGWDRDAAAIHGTSLLVLPGWLNWFTADIAFHHVHHLCSTIPNYHLARCHGDQHRKFAAVTRLRVRDVPYALGYILWDSALKRLVSVAELPLDGIGLRAAALVPAGIVPATDVRATRAAPPPG